MRIERRAEISDMRHAPPLRVPYFGAIRYYPYIANDAGQWLSLSIDKQLIVTVLLPKLGRGVTAGASFTFMK